MEDFKRISVTKEINQEIWREGLLEIPKNSGVWSRSALLYGQNDKIDVILHSRLRSVAPYSNILLPHVNHGLVHALRGCGILRLLAEITFQTFSRHLAHFINILRTQWMSRARFS